MSPSLWTAPWLLGFGASVSDDVMAEVLEGFGCRSFTILRHPPSLFPHPHVTIYLLSSSHVTIPPISRSPPHHLILPHPFPLIIPLVPPPLLHHNSAVPHSSLTISPSTASLSPYSSDKNPCPLTILFTCPSLIPLSSHHTPSCTPRSLNHILQFPLFHHTPHPPASQILHHTQTYFSPAFLSHIPSPLPLPYHSPPLSPTTPSRPSRVSPHPSSPLPFHSHLTHPSVSPTPRQPSSHHNTPLDPQTILLTRLPLIHTPSTHHSSSSRPVLPSPPSHHSSSAPLAFHPYHEPPHLNAHNPLPGRAPLTNLPSSPHDALIRTLIQDYLTRPQQTKFIFFEIGQLHTDDHKGPFVDISRKCCGLSSLPFPFLSFLPLPPPPSLQFSHRYFSFPCAPSLLTPQRPPI
ncbi:hypothetical protein C7M84_003275, partial [Penaeus vannamei]